MELSKKTGFEKCQLMDSSQQRDEIEIKKKEDVYSFSDIIYFILTEGHFLWLKMNLLLNHFLYSTIDWFSEPENRPTFEII